MQIYVEFLSSTSVFLKIFRIYSLKLIKLIKYSAYMRLYNTKIHSLIFIFYCFYKHFMFIISLCTYAFI